MGHIESSEIVHNSTLILFLNFIIIGFVVAIGAGTQSDLKIGQAVGVSWLGKSCMSCEACTQGEPKWVLMM